MDAKLLGATEIHCSMFITRDSCPEQTHVYGEIGRSIYNNVNVKTVSCPCGQRIKHYTMKAYGGVDV
jgi:hypothetical protein